jgi:hypothetical protein
MIEPILSISVILILLLLAISQGRQIHKLKELLRQALKDGDSLIKLVNTYRKEAGYND